MPRTWHAKNLTDRCLRVNRDFWALQVSSSFGGGDRNGKQKIGLEDLHNDP
jgi:hypothetical protein